MPKQKKFIWIIMLLSLLGLAAFFLLLKEKETTTQWTAESVKPYKFWYQINWQNQAIGWSSVELQKNSDAITVIEQDFITGRVQSQRMEFEFRRELNFENKKPYSLKSVTIDSLEPSLKVNKHIENNQHLTVRQARNSKETTSEHARIDYSLNDYLALNRWLEQKSTKQILLTKEFNNDDYGIHYSRYELLKKTSQKEPYFNIRHQLQNSNRLDDSYQSQASTLYFSKDLRLTRQQKANGMIYVASEGRVTINPEMQKDLYIASGIKVDQALGKAKDIDYLELAIPQNMIKKIATHPALQISANRLQLTKGYHYQPTIEPKAQDNAHPRAKGLAISLITGLSSPQEQVKSLVNYVYSNLTYQTLPASFEIDDILDNRIGDCTEHALLLTEMLNGIGIAARQVSGLIYLGDEKQRFGGHVWVEAYINGVWQAIDPTWNLLEVAATHIPLVIGADKTPEILKNAANFEFKRIKQH